MRAAPPGGESSADFQARVARAFALVVRRAASVPGVLVVVSHGLVIRAMLAAHIALPAGLTAPVHLGNTGLSMFDALPPHAASLVSCTRHLGATTIDDLQALSGG
jgi:probable phosphoglycerate mutase